MGVAYGKAVEPVIVKYFLYLPQFRQSLFWQLLIKYNKIIIKLLDKYPEIAKRLNASYNVVKPVGGGRYGKYSYGKETHQKCGAKPKAFRYGRHASTLSFLIFVSVLTCFQLGAFPSFWVFNRSIKFNGRRWSECQ
mgnify:CR=1 FL=1